MFLKSKIWLFHQFSIFMKDISEKIEQFIQYCILFGGYFQLQFERGRCFC